MSYVQWYIGWALKDLQRQTDRQTDTWGGRRFNPVGASVPAVNDPNKESWSVVTTLLGTWCV